MKNHVVKYIMILAALSLLMSCGNNDSTSNSGTPLIVAELTSFPTGSVPPGFNNGTVTVSVVDSTSLMPFTNATVIMNGVTLPYNDADKQYKGTVVVAPNGPITFSATVSGNTYTASSTQYGSCPTIVSPAPNTEWSLSTANTVTWSGGYPTTNAVYGIGALDAGNPNGNLVWPADNFLQPASIGSTSYTIHPDRLTAGSRYVIVGIATSVAITGVAEGSSLVVGGFNYVPVTVTM